MNKPTALALALMSLMTLPNSARAADLVATYSGFITDENTNDSVFGGHAAIGDAITASFYYTTSVPGTRTTTPGASDEVSGGLNFGTDPVISKAVFTSGAYSFSFMPDYYTDVYTSSTFLDVYTYDTNGNSSQTYILPNKAGPTNLDVQYSSGGVGDPNGRITQYSYVSDGKTTVNFDATRIVVSAAPEPGVWSLMFVGVGAMGLRLRRRRKSPVYA